MKRLIALLLICLLLCGCAAQPELDPSQPVGTGPVVDPTEPGGSYDPDNAVEGETDGAVRAYPLNIPDVYGMVCMGEDVVIFSGGETTTLTRLSGENLFVTATAQLDMLLDMDDPSLKVTEKGIFYFDPNGCEMVLLDQKLSRVGSIAVPADLVGTPVLSENRQSLFYCTATGVRVLDLETGISRLLKEMNALEQSVDAVLLNDTVVRCLVYDAQTGYQTYYLSAENGQTLHSSREAVEITSDGERYYAMIPGGVMNSYVYGTVSEEPSMLIPSQFSAQGCFLPEQNALISVFAEGKTDALLLESYDLATGRRTAQVELKHCGEPVSMAARNVAGQVYILCEAPDDGSAILYRWDTTLSPVEDDTVYTGAYYTLESPDLEGYAQCQSMADTIYATYGVRVLFGAEAVAAQPWDYDLTGEYQVPVLLQEMERLSRLLANYPTGFLSQAGEGTSRGCITVCLVRSIAGSPESGTLETVQGLQFRHEDNIYVALAVGGDLEQTLYHEMYHAIETRLLSNSNACYEWDKLNPDDFTYDYDFAINALRQDETYLEGEDRYFIDHFAMSFPSEDRARIMEYAMMPGNEEYFASEHMQLKLRTLCKGIREAFELQKSQDIFLWEQYLEEPLARQ